MNYKLEDIKKEMFKDFLKITEIDATNADCISIHLWKYANLKNKVKPNLLIDVENKLAACGDWSYKSKIEGAYLSGLNLANKLKNLI